MINEKDLQKMELIGKHKDSHSRHQDTVVKYVEKIEGHSEGKEWFFKERLPDDLDPTIEVVAQSIFHFLNPAHPEYKIVVDDAGKPIGVLSHKVEADQVTDEKKYDKATLETIAAYQSSGAVLSGSEKSDIHVLTQRRFKNLGAIQTLCLFVGETDLRWHNLFYHEKSGFIKIDGDHCFSRLMKSSTTTYSTKMVGAHIENLPYMYPSWGGRFNPWNWLNQVTGGVGNSIKIQNGVAVHNKNNYLEELQQGDQGLAFRQEVNETLLKILLIPITFWVTWVARYTQDEAQLTLSSGELFYQKKQLLNAALQNKSFVDFLDKQGAEYAKAFIEETPEFDPSMKSNMRFEFAKLQLFKVEVSEKDSPLLAQLRYQDQPLASDSRRAQTQRKNFSLLDTDDVLHPAVYTENGIAQLEQMIEEHKIDVNQKNSEGHTPLISAAIHESTGLMAMLLDAKADPSLKSDDEKTITDYALEFDSSRVIALLVGKNLITKDHYASVFNQAIMNSAVNVMIFMMENQLVPQDENSLISYFDTAVMTKQNAAAYLIYSSMTGELQQQLVHKSVQGISSAKFEMIMAMPHHKTAIDYRKLLEETTREDQLYRNKREKDRAQEAKVKVMEYLSNQLLRQSPIPIKDISSALGVLAQHGQLRVLEKLLDALDKKDNLSDTSKAIAQALTQAYQFNQSDVLDYLLLPNYFVTIFFDPKTNLAPFFSKIIERNDHAMLARLSDMIFNARASELQSIDTVSLIKMLINADNPELIRTFLQPLYPGYGDKYTEKRAAFLSQLDEKGDSFLTYALQQKKFKAFEKLVEDMYILGAKDGLFAANKMGSSPLFLAAEMGEEKAVNVLLKAYRLADINHQTMSQPNHNGLTPLMIAVEKGRIKVAEALLAAMDPKLRSVEINKPNQTGQSALMLAAKHSKDLGMATLLAKWQGTNPKKWSTFGLFKKQEPTAKAEVKYTPVAQAVKNKK